MFFRPMAGSQTQRAFSFQGSTLPIRLLFLLILLIGTTMSSLPASAITNYSNPIGSSAAWPSQITTYAYTRPGGVVTSDQSSGEGDNSKGANPTQSSDFSRGGSSSNPSVFYYGNGSILFFRIRLGGPPLALTGNSEPFSSETWNILLDTDGDGYKEFVVMLYGSDAGTEPDDFVIVYKDTTSQKFTIAANGLWIQDSAGPGTDGTNGETGSSSTWDLNGNAYVWDWGPTRVTQIDTTLAPGHNNSEYYVDIQVPISAFDTGVPATSITANSLFTLALTTSNSNTDPTQKDFMFSGTFALADVKLPTGNVVDVNGNTREAPYILGISNTLVCPNDTIKVTVLDAIDASAGVAITTVSSVSIEYYADKNANGVADDNSQWLPAGSASLVSGTLNTWRLVWDASTHSNIKYLFRAIATDSNGNVTNSSTQSPTAVLGTVTNTCAAVPTFDASTKTLVDPTLPMPAGSYPQYRLTIVNNGSGTAAVVTIKDTLSQYLRFDAFVIGQDAGCSVDSSTTWPSGNKRYIITCRITNVATGVPGTKIRGFTVGIITPIPDSTSIKNVACIKDSASGSSYCPEISFLVSSKPTIVLTKYVNGVVDTSGTPGDTLVFSIQYKNSGTSTATNVTVGDTTPTFTQYVVNSVKHKAVAKTDAIDGDEVTATPSGNVYIISVTVGTVLPDSTGTVTFKTKVQ